MPYSYANFRRETVAWIREHFGPETPTLDIGAGCGTYADCLPEYTALDAVEVWAPYIEEYGLGNKYRRVITEDVRNLQALDQYRLAILGDVLEHLTVEDAQALLQALTAAGVAVIIQVPYLCPQWVGDVGNTAENHYQPDLTHELFMDRYERFNLQLLCKDEQIGIYATRF